MLKSFKKFICLIRNITEMHDVKLSYKSHHVVFMLAHLLSQYSFSIYITTKSRYLLLDNFKTIYIYRLLALSLEIYNKQGQKYFESMV